MFENLSDRIAGTLLMGLDVAVEFATLGEFRLVEPELATASTPDSGSPPAPLLRRPGRELVVQPNLLPPPATALARAAASPGPAAAAPAGGSPATAEPGCQKRRRAAARMVEPPTRPPARVRGGSVPPSAQLCLLPD